VGLLAEIPGEVQRQEGIRLGVIQVLQGLRVVRVDGFRMIGPLHPGRLTQLGLVDSLFYWLVDELYCLLLRARQRLR
jgi:hypothetical protein